MKTQERNLGIDLLRVICMLAIIAQHLIGHGWIIQLLNRASWKYELVSALQALCIFGISCFALISGYVGIKSRYRYGSLVLLWLRVLLYSLLFTAITAAAVPGVVGREEILRALFPTIKSQYWYFTAYAGCFMLVPLIRTAMLRMNRRQATACVGALVLVLSVLNNAMSGDPFFTNGGKGTLWLAALYAIGAYIRRFEPLSRVPTAGLAGLTVAAAALLAGFEPVCQRIWLLMTGEALPISLYPHNDSPNTLLMATAMLLLFSRLKITRGKRLISVLGMASFGVYLIHDHPLVRRYTISAYAYQLTSLSNVQLIAGILLSAVGIYLVCAAIDLLCQRLFDALRLKQRIAALESRLIGNLWED